MTLAYKPTRLLILSTIKLTTNLDTNLDLYMKCRIKCPRECPRQHHNVIIDFQTVINIIDWRLSQVMFMRCPREWAEKCRIKCRIKSNDEWQKNAISLKKSSTFTFEGKSPVFIGVLEGEGCWKYLHPTFTLSSSCIHFMTYDQNGEEVKVGWRF